MNLLDFCNLREPAGYRTFEMTNAVPDAAGVIARYEIRLPTYKIGCCYFGGQRENNEMYVGNNGMPGIFRDDSEIRHGSFHLLLQCEKHYLALVPMSGPQSCAWFHFGDGRLQLEIGTMGTEAVSGEVPGVAWALAANPYEACQQVWQTALSTDIDGIARLRHQKYFPEYFRYLGWCSWEEYKEHISEDILREAITQIEDSALPFRWMMIDAGHNSVRDKQLTRFAPDTEKFPNGLTPITKLRRENGLRWFGIWWNMSGYMRGVHLQNELGELNDCLQPAISTYDEEPLPTLIPADEVVRRSGVPPLIFKRQDAASTSCDAEASFRFYDALLGSADEAGFDFVKVDFQSQHYKFYWGKDNAAASAWTNYQSLENITEARGLGLLNCICQNHGRTFSTRHSAVSRVTLDYKKRFETAVVLLKQAFGNALWIGQTMWPDYDMFHSDDPLSASMMSMARALSGGPVYLSDHPQNFRAEYILPLCNADGEIFRPLAPAAPLPDSIFIDPLTEPRAYRAIAPLENGCVAMMAMNLTETRIPVVGEISADDYCHASAMIQPYPGSWEIPEEGLLVYDWQNKTAAPLQDSVSFRLEDHGAMLNLLCPIHDGWSIIGRPDKYLSPAAVEILQCDKEQITVRMEESGPLILWSREGMPVSEYCTFRKLAKGLWETTECLTGKQPVTFHRSNEL